MMQPTARSTLMRMFGFEPKLKPATSDPMLTATSQSQQQEQVSQMFRQSIDYCDESDLDDMINKVHMDRAISLHGILNWQSERTMSTADPPPSFAHGNFPRESEDEEDNPMHT